MATSGHERGCDETGMRPSTLVSGYSFCPACKRMVDDPTVTIEPAAPAPSLFGDVSDDTTSADADSDAA